MIDLHTHILPEVDDGSSCLEESLDMASIAAETGTHCIVTTLHCNIPGLYKNYKSDFLVEVFMVLKRELKRAEIPITLMPGMELFCTEDLPQLFRDGKVYTLNNTKYFLTEMAFDEDPYFFEQILDEIAEMGYHPIIAHPERYYSVQDHIGIAEHWFEKGWGLQINRGSIQGRFGRKEKAISMELLKSGYCTCIASDAHSSSRRTPDLGSARKLVEDLYGKRMAALLFRENPKRILTGRNLIRPTDLLGK